MQMPSDLFYSYTVTHRTGSYVNGTWTISGTSTATIRACIQPASAWQMRSLPEGRREDAGILIVTPTQLVTLKDAPTDKAPDLVSFDGASWELMQQDPFGHLGVSEKHYEYIAARLA